MVEGVQQGFLVILGPWVQAVPPGPVLPMLLHIVRYEREEVGFLMILSGGRGPEILAASTPLLRGAHRVLLDLSVLAIFPMTSMSMALSILHVGLVLGVELQLHRDLLHDILQAHAGKDDPHPQRLSAPPLRIVEARQPLPHGVAEYLDVDDVLQPQQSAGLAEVLLEKPHYSGVGVLRCRDPYDHALLCSLLLLILHSSLPVAGEDVLQQVSDLTGLIPVLHQLEASSVLADVPIQFPDPQLPALQQQRNGPQILQLLVRGVHSLLVLQPLEAGLLCLDQSLADLIPELLLQVLRQPSWECPTYPLVPWRSLHLPDDLLGEVLPIQDEVIQVGGVAIVVGVFDSPEVVNPDGVSDVCSHHSTEMDTTCGRRV